MIYPSEDEIGELWVWMDGSDEVGCVCSVCSGMFREFVAMVVLKMYLSEPLVCLACDDVVATGEEIEITEKGRIEVGRVS